MPHARPAIDDDEEDFDERGLLKDGRRHRVSMAMMDAAQRSLASSWREDWKPAVRHSPGYLIADAALQDAAQTAYDERSHSYQEAWKTPQHGAAAPPRAHSAPTAHPRFDSGAHLRDAAVKSRDEWIARAENAWRNDGDRPPSAAPPLMLSTTFDRAAAQRRDDAWRAKQRAMCEAWRTPS